MQDLISADDHLIEPPSLWQDRLPEKYRTEGPSLRETEGRSYWAVEGKRYPLPRKNEMVNGLSAEAFGTDEHTLDQADMLPSFYDPKIRADLLQTDGIVGSLCFPTFPRFAGTLFLDVDDKQLADLCVRAWNDFIFEEWCAARPDFFIPMVITQLWDPVLAASELRRCADLGARAVSFPENPVPLGLPSFYTDFWDPVWDAAQEAGLVICMHVGTSGKTPQLNLSGPAYTSVDDQMTVISPDGPTTPNIVACETNAIYCMINLLFSPVPIKYPQLQFVLSESGLGWIPAFLERSDREWETHRVYEELNDVRPSEIFHRSFYGCFVGDPVAIAVRDLIGVKSMLWECDYPHAESPFGRVQELVSTVFEGVPQDEVDLITHGNARRLFRW